MIPKWGTTLDFIQKKEVCMAETETTIYQRPVELLQKLIRFNTTNPPGNEAECIGYIDSLLTNVGVKTTILARDSTRPNLIARLAGRRDAPPLLLYGHVDVVTTANQPWQYPPFEGRVVDGCVWGRGSLDDKGGVAMSLSALLRATAEGLVPPGDVVLAILCDEEAGGWLGARYLVDNHSEQFAGVRYAIGETGGFAFHLGGRRFYPIMVAEKRVCLLKATVRGPTAHAAAVVVRGGAAARLGSMLTRLDQARLPVHVTSAARGMFERMSSNVPFPRQAGPAPTPETDPSRQGAGSAWPKRAGDVCAVAQHRQRNGGPWGRARRGDTCPDHRHHSGLLAARLWPRGRAGRTASGCRGRSGI